jgi:hypothetical protein
MEKNRKMVSREACANSDFNCCYCSVNSADAEVVSSTVWCSPSEGRLIIRRSKDVQIVLINEGVKAVSRAGGSSERFQVPVPDNKDCTFLFKGGNGIDLFDL